jgi:hypothetical protein
VALRPECGSACLRLDQKGGVKAARLELLATRLLLMVTVCGAACLLAQASALADVTVGVATPAGAQTVYRHADDQCNIFEGPDLPARAYRDQYGRVVVTISHDRSFRLLGDNLQTVTAEQNYLGHPPSVPAGRPCTNAQLWPYPDLDPNARLDHNPAHYQGLQWLASPWTLDGQTVYAFALNEYHGELAPNNSQCSPAWAMGQCTMSSIVALKSSDGGATYSYRPSPSEPTDRLVATVPATYQKDWGWWGYSPGSNVIWNRGHAGEDGWYYALVLVVNDPTDAVGPAVNAGALNQQSGVCVMRGLPISDPKSWSFWDGTGFGGKFIDPYQPSAPPASKHLCQPVSYEGGLGGGVVRSLTWNSYLQKFMAVGLARPSGNNSGPRGFYYSLSDNLIDWTRREAIQGFEDIDGTGPGSPKTLYGCQDGVTYPSILDAGDPANTSGTIFYRNFDQPTQTPYLFFTCGHPRLPSNPNAPNADLVRVSLQINRTADDATFPIKDRLWPEGATVNFEPRSSRILRNDQPSAPFCQNLNVEDPPGQAEVVCDVGAAYSKARGYGWIRENTLTFPFSGNSQHTPWNLTPNAVDRHPDASHSASRLTDTFIAMQYPGSDPRFENVPGAWEMAVPSPESGSSPLYCVRVTVGDSDYMLPLGDGDAVHPSTHVIHAEGITVEPSFTESPGQTQSTTKTLFPVPVSDGRLTIDAMGGTNTKIDSLAATRYNGSSGGLCP